MKLLCEIVQDLLPLYEDNVCSQESKIAVEEHLKDCPICREQVKKMGNVSEPEISVEMSTENRIVKKGFRKVRRKWAMSLLAVLLIIPILVLAVNQVRGTGICYTNIDDILTARSYVQNIENKNYNAVAEMVNYEIMYDEIQELLGDNEDGFKPNYVSVTIGQSEWMMQEEVYQKYRDSFSEEKAFWNKVILENTSFIIPIDIWNSIVLDNPDNFVTQDEYVFIQREIDEEGDMGHCEPYVRIETKWGDFMIRQHNGVNNVDSAADFCNITGLVPVELYHEAKTEFDKLASEQYQYIQDKYAHFDGMSFDDFRYYMIDYNEQKLKDCDKDGFTFKNTGYKGSTYIESEKIWEIIYSMDVTYNNNTYSVFVTLSVCDGKIVTSNVNYGQEFVEGNIIDDVLSMNYRK